ncbi:MAG: hypothetical protein QW689_07865, partial [Nitrososphaerota archaeon]
MKQGLNHQNIGKICSIAIVLALLLAALPLAVKAQQQAYPPGEWKFRIVDDWGKWEKDLPSQAKPLGDKFSAVAILFNSTPPYPSTGPWTFENWIPIAQAEANEEGWITLSGLPGNVWDEWTVPNWEINYTLIIKLKIGGTLTPITIFNATVLRIRESPDPYYTPHAVGLYDLLNATAVAKILYSLPTAYYRRGSIVKDWITTTSPANATEVSDGKHYAKYKVWLYYVALQPLDEFGFPITGATLEVRYNSSYTTLGGKTYITNKKESGWVNKLYGTWATNGTMGSEFVPDPTYILHANYKVGWVVLRVPLINRTTAYDSTYKSSLVSNLTFIWRYKTGTPINVTMYYVLQPTAEVSGAPWLNRVAATPPAVGMYSNYLGPLLVNSTHQVNATVRWVMLNLTDCIGNDWWTMKADVSAFDTKDKNEYPLVATRVAPGRYLLRYPVPRPPYGNTTIVLTVQWYYSRVNMSRWL